jgi:hypothetical protein
MKCVIILKGLLRFDVGTKSNKNKYSKKNVFVIV